MTTVYANHGHGHVYPRADGVKARCGGPGICVPCSKDRAMNDAVVETPHRPMPLIRTASEELKALKAALREHWLYAITCDHDKARDKPICACSSARLGWHQSVGEAVEAWAEHVEKAARERISNPATPKAAGR